MILLSSFLPLVLAAAWAVGLLADNSELYPRFGSMRQELFLQSFSCDQILIGDATASGCENKAIEPLQSVIFHIAKIKAKRELVNVTVQMLLTRVMVNAIQTAFQNRPNTLNRVRACESAFVFAVEVVDGRVSEEKPVKAAIRSVFVGVECRADLNIVVNRLLYGWQFGIGYRHRNDSTVALTHSENGLFTDRAATEIQFQIDVLIGFFTADIGFVNFNHSAKFIQFGTASLSEPLEHKPRRFLRNTYLFAQLKRRNALTSRYEQIHRINPFVKRNVRPFKDRASPNREIEFAGVTAIVTAFANCDAFTRFTSRTSHAIRPETGFQIKPSGFCIRDRLEQLKSGYCASTHR